MFDTSKRKNEDKAKGFPRRRAVMIGLFIAFAITLIGVGWRLLSYPSASRPTGQIFYTRDDVLMVVNLQTGEHARYEPATPPSYNPTNQTDLNLSPDGKWRTNWIGMSPDGITETSYLEITNTETHITDKVGPIYAGPGHLWSPDSQSLFFMALPHPFTEQDADGHTSELWRVDIPTHQLIRLTNNTYLEHSLQVSPDSAKLAYIGPVDSYSRLHIMDVATGQSIIPAPDMFIFIGSWSPDSQWYAFETNHANGISDIWITRADGSETQGIALDPNAWERAPLWTP